MSMRYDTEKEGERFFCRRPQAPGPVSTLWGAVAACYPQPEEE